MGARISGSHSAFLALAFPDNERFLKNGEAPEVRAMQKMSLAQWRDHIRRGHIPYSKRCQTCVQEMCVDAHHRRQLGAGSAYCVSADIMGPFQTGLD